MHNCPDVSVVMPCYNCENTIRETIESLRNQTIQSWELLCVDDGSSDKTVDVVRTYCELDSRIKLIIRESNLKGGSVCRNIGVKAAAGSYIMFLDADDILSKNCLEIRIENAKIYDCDFCVFPYGTFFHGIEDARPHKIATKNAEYKFATSMSGWIITSSFMKLEFLKRIEAFDEKFPRLQDVEMHLRALTTPGVTYRILPSIQPDCFYRSFENGYSLEKLQRSMIAYEKFLKLLDQLLAEKRFANKKLFALSATVLYGNLAMVRYKLWCNNKGDKYSESFTNLNIYNNIDAISKRVISFLNKDYRGCLQAIIKFRLSWLIFIVAQRRLNKQTGQ